MLRNREFIIKRQLWPFLATRGQKIISENSPNQYEMYSMVSMPENDQKLPTAAIFLPPEGQNLTNVPPNRTIHLSSVYKIYEADSVTSIPDNGWKPPIVDILQLQECRNLTNVAKKWNNFWELSQPVYTPVFQIMVESHRLSQFSATRGKKLPKWPNMKPFLKAYLISAYTKYDVD